MRKLAVIGVVAVLVSGASAQTNEWKTSISLGVNSTDGNSDTLSLNGGILSEKITDKDSWRIGADGQYGETDGEKNNEQAKGLAAYRHILTGRTYGLLGMTLAYDAVADIDYRLAVSPGLGYYFLKDDKATLGVELGPTWIKEKVSGVEDDYFAARLGERFDYKVSATAKIWQAAEYLPSVDDAQDDYLFNAEIGIEAQVNAKVALRLVAKDTYDSTPGEDREKNDTSVVGALVYTL